jgi:Rnl2 family RNA ligase
MFQKYKSIAKTYDTITIEYYKQQGYNKQEWYVTEKIHGANFSFISGAIDTSKLSDRTKEIVKTLQDNENTDYFAKANLDYFIEHAGRAGILKEGELLNYQSFTYKLNDKIKALAKHLNKTIQIVTEMYGKGVTGKPHIPYTDESKVTINNQQVDTRDFVAYDIRIGDNEYMNYEEAVELFKQFDIPYMPILFKGTMEECIAYSPEFKSLLAKSNGIDTDAEGIVIKPMNSIFTITGDRVILKNVADKFQENKLTKGQADAIKEKKQDSGNKALIDSCLTEMRVSKVAAKFGISVEDKATKFKLLLNELSKDIIEEIDKEHQLKVDVKLVNQLCTPLVKTFFV